MVERQSRQRPKLCGSMRMTFCGERKRSLAMCECCKPKTCEKGKDPKECTPEQVKECHGDTDKHNCEQATAKK